MMSARTMQAAILDSPDAAFRIATVPRPTPQPGQVLVRIEASAVNPLDIKIRAGHAAHARQPLPAVLGIVYDTVGGATLDASFNAVARFGHVVSALGWGTHALAPLSFRAASYSGVFTLLPMLTGEGRAHHGEILREATRLIDAGKVVPRIDPRHFTLSTVGEAYRALESKDVAGKIVVDIDE